uniref:Uncharacterized protein n=1 Tax=Anguilla anguilla TaxID=7936 RepID=A0A0E9XZG8_ANGAN
MSRSRNVKAKRCHLPPQ